MFSRSQVLPDTVSIYNNHIQTAGNNISSTTTKAGMDSMH